MAKAIALFSYLYQALLAFGALLVVARFIPAADYAAYSVLISTTQLIAIALFEWIRFACSRFYPGPDAGTEATQRATMNGEMAIGIGLCLLGAGLAVPFGLSPLLAALGAVIVILQGWTDLHLTMLRFRQEFRLFSALQGLRATAIAIGTIAGAAGSGRLEGAIAGLAAGYLGMSGLALLLEAHRVSRTRHLHRAHWSRAVAAEHLRYGSAAAGASVLGLAAPLGLRLVLQASFGSAAAGALLAIDLLQRPFVLVISALHGVQYPAVVKAFDDAARDLARQLGFYYALLVSLAVLGAAAVVAILPLVTQLLVPADMQPAFSATALPVLALFLLRAIAQNVFSTPAHLLRRPRTLVGLALIDALLLNGLAWLAAGLPGANPASVAALAALGALIYALIAIGVVRALPFALFWQPPLVALMALAITTILVLASWNTAGAALACLAGGALGLLTLYALYRAFRAMRAAPIGP
jgi:O-antigen/teichoic acid export membrane protein